MPKFYVGEKLIMVKNLKFYYRDSSDVLNVLVSLAETLSDFGVNLEILEGGDGFEASISKIINAEKIKTKLNEIRNCVSRRDEDCKFLVDDTIEIMDLCKEIEILVD